MAKSANQYEGMFLLGPSGAEPEKAIGIVKTMIEKHGGKIQVIKKWDERKLAYEIGKQKRGTYIISFFQAPGSAVTALERDVKLSEDILRVLVTRADHLEEKEITMTISMTTKRATTSRSSPQLSQTLSDPNSGSPRPHWKS